MCVLAGTRVRPGLYATGTLQDAGATVLALAGIATATGANGRAWMDSVDMTAISIREQPERNVADDQPPTIYSDVEASLVAERLRALGYIE